MAGITLFNYQEEALHKMKNGCILCGGVGSGKSRTSLAYFYTEYGGQIGTDSYVKMKDPPNLYIITTAQKRDKFEWDSELSLFLLSQDQELNAYENTVIVDSWNNIEKYIKVENAFFIFDEQRLVGYGAWAHAFFKIAKKNRWILLSATPGDKWMDYMSVFIANGFYKNKRQFEQEHVVYNRFAKFPQIDRYFNTSKLNYYRRQILVEMNFERNTVEHHIDIPVLYDRFLYKEICESRKNPETGKPFKNASAFCYALRRVTNSDKTRAIAILDILEKHPRIIVFYNFNYELDILKNLEYGEGVEIAEWNGQKHQDIPTGKSWVYLVQYNAGAEGWNCITTDTMIFYSQNYSYKIMEQASGRINRLNTPYIDLYYYHLVSKSWIDIMITRAITAKKIFSESAFTKGYEFKKED